MQQSSQRSFTYLSSDQRSDKDTSRSDALYIEKELEEIAKEPYMLIEDPEVTVMDSHMDDILFEIQTRSRTTKDLIAF